MLGTINTKAEPEPEPEPEAPDEEVPADPNSECESLTHTILLPINSHLHVCIYLSTQLS